MPGGLGQHLVVAIGDLAKLSDDSARSRSATRGDTFPAVSPRGLTLRRYAPGVKVFISWSGQPSRSIAKALTGWLQSVVQHVDAWMSDEEVGSGARWSDATAQALGETNFGIVCVTRANPTCSVAHL
jgi:hypothetical protein